MSNATTHIVTENQLLPSLRFKEFEGDWESSKVGKLGNFKGGGTPSTDISEYWEGETPWISSSDVNENDVSNLNITRHLTNKAITESATKIIPKDSVLFVSRVGVGKLAVSRVDLCTSQDFANLIPVKDSSYFIAYYFIARNKLLHQYSQGTSIKGFTTGDLKSIPINIPSLPEQQKIAAFLTAVDKKIQQLTRKKELLEQYKKEVMQKLFSRELRFKDENGNPYPDWNETRLKHLCEPITKGTTPKRFSKEGVTFIKIEGIKGINFNKEKCLFIDDETHLKELRRSILKVDDILFAIAGSVGKLGLVTEELLPANTNQAFAIIRLKNLKSLKFIIQVLNSRTMKKYIYQSMSVGAQPNLNLEQIGDFKFSLPYVEEQQKIATYLSSIDTKIEAVNNQIIQTLTFKKGLLQQLFV